MQSHFGFEPDAGRARMLDRCMHAELGKSLLYLCQVAEGLVPYDVEAMRDLIEQLASGVVVSPVVFHDYYQLAFDLIGEDFAGAERSFAQLAAARPLSRAHRNVVPLDDPNRCSTSARYLKCMTDGSDIGMLPPTKGVAAEFHERLNSGMKLLEHAAPELAAEVNALVREVVCVVGDSTRKMQFDGGSHFQLWGALFLNAQFHLTDWSMVEVLAHESAHSLLFGFCTEEPLVFNEDHELYDSPLRVDPRPMDGIYHATFVSARMHWAMGRLIDSDLLSMVEFEQAQRSRDKDRENFEAGYDVVQKYADLSFTGNQLMTGARRYMDLAP
jgi:hypothetical protein